MAKRKLPHILLVGAGSFGKHHLRVLKELEAEGKIVFTGVMVRTTEDREAIEKEFGVPTFSDLSPELLKDVDAVDIVTPPETHFEIIKKCLPYTNVFAEKPLAMTEIEVIRLSKLAKRFKRMLAVGHIFRYHSVTKKLVSLLGQKDMPRKMKGFFVNPITTDRGREPSLEMLHLFDIVDMLWTPRPLTVHARKEGRISIVDVRYEKIRDAHFEVGWRGIDKKRTLTFTYPEETIEADFIANTITIHRGTSRRVVTCPLAKEPLYVELSSFVKALAKGTMTKDLVDADTAGRVVALAEKAIPQDKSRLKIAVIGGGIFGISAALELGKHFDVTLFEKNKELLQEGSKINQFRHHFGYHYPRSDETVIDVQRSRADFEEVFEEAIIRTTPTYYGLAKEGSLVGPRQFIAFCKRHQLPYENSYPPPELMDPKQLSLCIEVPEPNYHFEKFIEVAKRHLRALPRVTVLYDTYVTDCRLFSSGKKSLTYKQGKKAPKKEVFDIVINATYANINRLTKWLSFDPLAVRVDRAEVLIVKLPIPPISLTVIDGPFATLMPTGNPNEFTLYHVRESILDRYVPEDGLIKRAKNGETRAEAIYRESLKLFPILKDANIVESRIVHRGVRAYHEHDDSRVADLIEHGFGCWSILSGKILSSVSIAKRLLKIIRS